MGGKDLYLMAHLMRRAGFGATREELDGHVARGYDATVADLLDTEDSHNMSVSLIRRYHPEHSGMMGNRVGGAQWLYRMISTDAPLREKTALFWHGIFATGYAKLANGKVLHDQIRMFLRHGMGSFKTLLLELSKDPAMIIWLDNNENHKGAINENFGRELLELFSMGTGNYTEDDIKAASRAFTGWTIGNTEYMTLKSMRDSVWPYGRLSFHFEYRPEDHDDEEKEFLGQKGRFNGEDIVDIICQQPATARFIARHMYSFFVADEPPVPEWPYTDPRDPEAIEALTRAYFESEYDILSMLRVLFNSDFFKSEDCWYQRVKSPAELMAGVLRLTDEFHRPRMEIDATHMQMTFMGQWLLSPPSVEGWHGGTEWLNSGSLVERVNFASGRLADPENPGVKRIIENIVSTAEGGMSPEQLVDSCLDQVGAITVSEDTRSALVDFTAKDGHFQPGAGGVDESTRQRVTSVLQRVASTPEFLRA